MSERIRSQVCVHLAARLGGPGRKTRPPQARTQAQAALPQACACKIVVWQTATLWSRGWARTGQETTPATCQELSQVSAQVILLRKSQACADFSQRFSQR